MNQIKELIFCLFILLIQPCYAQHFELGIGDLSATGFPNGVNFHGFGGYEFGKKFTLGLSTDFSKLKSDHSFHDMIVDRSVWDKPKLIYDTFYNVYEKNDYSFFDLSLEPRFYSTKEFSKFFFCPSFGLGFFKQRNTFSNMNPEYHEYGLFTALNPSLGLEIGKEYAINKSKKLFFQIDFSLKTYFGFEATDIYLAPFTLSKAILKGRIGMVWKVDFH